VADPSKSGGRIESEVFLTLNGAILCGVGLIPPENTDALFRCGFFVAGATLLMSCVRGWWWRKQ
jgi:hypothetical protein